MQRADALKSLSNDHHRALVYAKKARQSTDEAGASALWQELRDYYHQHLQQHFQVEEDHMLSHLRQSGHDVMADRLLAEHHAMSQFFATDATRDLDALQHFGELLKQHVRFEERELFNLIQDTLSETALAALAQASQAVPSYCPSEP